jgi:hypothetical protein
MKKASRTPAKESRRAPITGHVLYTAYSAAVPGRAVFVEQQLLIINSVFRKLFSDDNFRTLMRAEELTAIPVYFKLLLEDARRYASEE